MSQILHLYNSSGLFHTVAPVPDEAVDNLVVNSVLSSRTLTPPDTLVIFGRNWFPSPITDMLPAIIELGD